MGIGLINEKKRIKTIKKTFGHKKGKSEMIFIFVQYMRWSKVRSEWIFFTRFTLGKVTLFRFLPILQHFLIWPLTFDLWGENVAMNHLMANKQKRKKRNFLPSIGVRHSLSFSLSLFFYICYSSFQRNVNIFLHWLFVFYSIPSSSSSLSWDM